MDLLELAPWIVGFSSVLSILRYWKATRWEQSGWLAIHALLLVLIAAGLYAFPETVGGVVLGVWVPFVLTPMLLVRRMQVLEAKQHFVYMEGSKVFKHAVTTLSSGMSAAIEGAGLTPDQLDVFIPHQANSRIMDACLDRTRIQGDIVYSVLEKYGNLSAASVPVAMDEARKAGALRDGQLLGVTAFGAGLTWGAGVLRM